MVLAVEPSSLVDIHTHTHSCTHACMCSQILILSENYHLSIPAGSVPCLWAVSRVGFVNTTS